MCWTNYKNFIFHKIAKEDIICYKIFRAQEIHYKKTYFFFGKKKIDSLYSIIRNFKYVPYQKQYHVDLHVDKRLMLWSHRYKTYYAIEEGYHSYATLRRANNEKEKRDSSVIIECIIPKYAEYYINDVNEIVSSTIIVTDKIVN